MANPKSVVNAVDPTMWVCPQMKLYHVPYLPVLTQHSIDTGAAVSAPPMITAPSADPSMLSPDPSNDTAPGPAEISDWVLDGVPFQTPVYPLPLASATTVAFGRSSDRRHQP